MHLKPRATVLLADDEPLLARLVCRVLEGAGYGVITVATPAKACEALGGEPRPDVLVLDATLSRRMGKDVLRRVLASPAGPGLVLVSGAELEPDLLRLLTRHGGRFLAKPFEPVQLVGAVGEVLDARPTG